MEVIALVLSGLVLALLHCEVHCQCGSWLPQFYTVNEGGSTGSVTLTAQYSGASSQQLLRYTTRDDTATAQGAYLEFLERTNNSLTLIRCDDCASPAIILENKLVPFGNLQHSEAFVASNGIISFGSAFTNFDATLFPNPNNQGIFNSFIVAPYWSDIDARVFGEIWYETHVVGQSTVSNSLLDRVSSLVRSEQNHPTFQGTWMLVATWNDTVQFGASSEQRNTFQGVVITDTIKTYAVYIYRCNDIEWSDGSVIGFNAGGSFFANHPLSDSTAARDIDCVNSPGSERNNVVYDLNPNVPAPGPATNTNNTGDYLGANGTLTFDAENTTQDVQVFLRNDQVFEPTETFFVDLTQLDGTLCDTATVFIQDDDQPPTLPTSPISPTPPTGTQGATCPTQAQRELAQRVVTASLDDFMIIANNNNVLP